MWGSLENDESYKFEFKYLVINYKKRNLYPKKFIHEC